MSSNAGDAPAARPKLPFKIRMLFLLGQVFPGLPPISVKRIMREAQRQTGLTDWGDAPLEEGLSRLVASFKREAKAHIFARMSFKAMCVRQAAVRLGVARDLAQHPDILETPIRGPLFVAGLPRTGTTLLHNLLALDPEARPLLYWEQECPTPPPQPETHDSDPRIAESARRLEQIYRVAPQLPAIHHMSPQAPEECNGLMETCFASHRFPMLYDLPSYMAWLQEADLTEVYAHHKQQLQILSWRFPPKRWTLKAPSHLSHLEALLRVYPDARIVITHRDPAEALPSICSLAHLFRRLASIKADPKRLGPQLMEMLATGLEKAEPVRAAHPQKFVDVGYRRLVAEPIATVRAIYERFGLPVSAAFEEAMNQWLAENRQHKHGVHQYTLADFGLTEAMIQTRFAAYLERSRDLI